MVFLTSTKVSLSKFELNPILATYSPSRFFHLCSLASPATLHVLKSTSSSSKVTTFASPAFTKVFSKPLKFQTAWSQSAGGWR